MILGTTSSTGVAFGKIFILDDPETAFQESQNSCSTTLVELDRFNSAVENSLLELEKLREEIRSRVGEEEEKIFEAQALILEDPAFIEAVRNRIIQEELTASDAVKNTIIELEQQFLNIEDKTLRLRIADIKDVGIRVLRQLNQKKSDLMRNLSEPVILITRELLPSQAAQLNKEKILAIVTEKGGINSHASIIARSLDIPAVVGAKGLLRVSKTAQTAIVDAFAGTIDFDPSPCMLARFERIRVESERRKASIASAGPVKTKDGKEIFLYANISKISELNSLKEHRIEGVGLLRTEFLIMNRQTPPSSEDFTSHFKTVLDFAYPLPVNIRLLDVGSDKTFPFLATPKEHNPSLGNRGIRFLMRNPHLLKSQIQGILEASIAGNARVLIPMVTTIQEVREIRAMLRSLEMELTDQGRNIKTHIPLGLMIETPAAALLSERFAREVDFFSIGSNDLTQYTLAADRDNENVDDIYSCLHPAVLQLIQKSVRASEKACIEISVCGEMAFDERAVPLLLGMGIHRLSVSPGHLDKLKNFICRIDLKKAEKLARKALRLVSTSEIEDLVESFLDKMEKENMCSI